MSAAVRHPGLYRFRGKIGVVSSSKGVFVFTALDSGGSIVNDVLTFEPEKVALRWSDLEISAPSARLTKEVVQESLDSFADFLVEYCEEHAEEMSAAWPSWVKVDHDEDETHVHWEEANVFEVVRIFNKWYTAYRPSTFSGFDSWRAMQQLLVPVQLSLDDLVKLSQILRRAPTEYDHVLFMQAVSAFVSQTIRQLIKQERVTII